MDCIIIRKIVDECLGEVYLLKNKTVRVLSPLEIKTIKESSIQDINNPDNRGWITTKDVLTKIGIEV